MISQNYHLTLAKGGPNYPHLPEQSYFAHLVNGVFGLAQITKFLIGNNISTPGLDEESFRKVLAVFTIHEVHKNTEVELMGRSQFSIPLERLRKEYELLGLNHFAQVDEHLMRAANVHKRSIKSGDLLLSDEPNATRLWLWVRIADTLASVKNPFEAMESLQSYLADLGPAFAPQSPPGRYSLYYHEIKDVRGVLTNTIHQAVAQQLEEVSGFYPLLYFATGTLYVGPSKIPDNITQLIPAIAQRVLQPLTQGAGADTIRDGLRRQRFDFEPYVYAFAKGGDLLQVVQEDTLAVSPDPKVPLREVDGLAERRRSLPPGWRNTVEARFGIQLLDPKEHKTFNELWSSVYRYLLYVDTLLRDLNPSGKRLDWFLRTFSIPRHIADNLRREADIWAKSGIGKYVLVIAYHFLRGPDFADRAAEALTPGQVLGLLHKRVGEALRQIDTRERREAVVAKLGLRQDLEAYLAEYLHLSFAPMNRLSVDGLTDYLSSRRKGHSGKVCSICNRHSRYVQELRTGVLDDFGRVFSNRVLPARKAPQGNRLWCPVCQLEFILRKVMGMSLPAGAHYKNSRRIYFYILPTFSFTPEHLRLFESLFRPFHRVTNLPIRDYGKDLGLPHYWLEHHSFDPEWVELLQNVLTREADKISEWGGRSFVGERISLGRVQGQPHYYLITWERAARDSEHDDARIATRTEAWAKAIFAATIIGGLTSCKVYVTEHPYLPVSDPADLRATITLNGVPSLLRGLLGGRSDTITLYGRERDHYSELERVLDLSAALWMVTTDVHAPQRKVKDKRISDRLEVLNTSPMAGAIFYKEYCRLNDGRSPFPVLAKACEVLLDVRGGELMDLVERIARKSLEIALPQGTIGRGKAQRYELIFREGVSAFRKAQQMIPEIRMATLGGYSPTEQSIAELKQLMAGTLLKGLERRRESHRGKVFIRAWGQELSRLVGEFVDLLVDDLYLDRAKGEFTNFLRLENSLADGIYYYTDRNLSRYWEEYKQEKALNKV